MDELENRYVLKRIVKSTDEYYTEALSIYTKETPVDIYTPSNEITIWLDKKTPCSSFEMLLFCLLLDGVTVGFAQVTYIKRTEISILDYITLKNPYRVNSVFLNFLNMIQNYMDERESRTTYYIAEISNKDNGTNIDKESEFYKRNVCLENYGCVMSQYYNFPLGLDNYESDFESLMYIKTNDSIAHINSETFLDLVNSICYDYYLKWYSEILTSDELETYKAKLENCINKIKRSVENKREIKIVYSYIPSNNNGVSNKTYGSPPTKKKSSVSKTILLIVSIIAIPIFLTAFFQFIMPLVSLNFEPYNSFIGSVVASIVTVFIAYTQWKNK